MALDPTDADNRRLSPKALAAIERGAFDYSRKIKDPRRQIRRLLDHVDALSDEIADLNSLNPGKD